MRAIASFCLFFALLVMPGCLCAWLCPTPPPLLSELDWSTPEAAVATYRKAFRAGNAHYESLCLSDQLKNKYGIGAVEYNLGRDRFIDENQGLVGLFLDARDEPPRRGEGDGPERVVVRIRRGDYFADFLLVNEPVAWINFVEDGEAITMEIPVHDLPSHLRVKGKALTIHDLPPGPYAMPPVNSIQKITLTDRWRLMDIVSYSSSLKQALSKTSPKKMN